MSFFDYNALFSLKPPQREETPCSHETPKRPESAEGSWTPITLSGIRDALYDTDDEESALETESPGSPETVPGASSWDITPEAKTVEEILEATKKYLDAKVQAQDSSVDRATEFKFEKMVLHPKGNPFPEFSTAEELRHISNASDLTIPVKKMGMTIDREVMDRLQAGMGPRPSKVEDLIEKLRLEPRTDVGSDGSTYAVESYAHLLTVVRAWNKYVGDVPDLTQERLELCGALEERCHLITEVEKKRQGEEVLEHQIPRVRRSLHAIWPEIKDFRNQNFLDLLTLIIANHGITVPELDDEAKSMVIKTLYREIRSTIYHSAEHTMKKLGIKEEIEQAKLDNDVERVKELLKQKTKLKNECWNQATDKVRTSIKFARKKLHENVLEEMQSLVGQQAGQKWAACGITKVPAPAVVQDCIKIEDEMNTMLRDWESEIDNVLNRAILSVRKMKKLAIDDERQVRKFAGLDVSKAERRSVMERRKKDPRTPHIMTEVLKQSLEVQAMCQPILEHMGDLEWNLSCISDVASVNYKAYNSLLAHVEESTYCAEGSSVNKKVRERVHAVEESTMPNRKVGWRMKAQRLKADEPWKK